MTVVLHQFAFSHFNEKVRWALAYKNVTHNRETYLPGPHMRPIRQMTAQTSTPVLELNGEYVAGSAQILARLESDHPATKLLPENADAANAVLAWQSRLDEELGPATRAVLFDVLINELGYLARTFASQTGTLKRLGYRAMLPLVRPLMKQGNGVTPEKVAAAQDVVSNYLNQIAEAAQDTGYLVGDQFTLADLTAAALLAPLMSVEHEDMARPQPMPQSLADLQAKYAGEPAVLWAQEIYANHR
ncbi:MAG: glutathione S-transferase N-terminal domain-containing protein [Pseudomonadota bacterium]